MDIAKDIEIVKSLICKDIAVVASDKKAELVAYPPFVYPDGDGCTLYLSRSSNGWLITDDGDVLMHSAYGGVDVLDRGHRERLDKMLATYGVKQDGGVLSLLTPQEQLGSSFFTFTQACLDVMNLARTPATKKKKSGSLLRQRIALAIQEVFPQDAYEHTWHHPNDEDDTYSVDYLVKTAKQNYCVFGIASDTSCLKAACTCYHLKQKKFPFAGVAVCEAVEKIHAGAIKPLTDAVRTEIVAAPDEKTLRKFFLSLATAA
jgi:hypothetical protein